MTGLLASALLAIWDRIRGQVRDRLAGSFSRLRDAAEPPVGIVLSAPDGSVYTGVTVVERNKVILLIAFREYGVARPATPANAPVRPAPSPFDRPDQGSPYGRSPLSLFDQERPPFDDEPPWRR